MRAVLRTGNPLFLHVETRQTQNDKDSVSVRQYAVLARTMQLRHLKTLHPPSEMAGGKFQKITAMAWWVCVRLARSRSLHYHRFR